MLRLSKYVYKAFEFRMISVSVILGSQLISWTCQHSKSLLISELVDYWASLFSRLYSNLCLKLQ
jgi:hypothetical protein